MTIGIDASRSVDAIQKTGVEKVSRALCTQIKDLILRQASVFDKTSNFVKTSSDESAGMQNDNGIGLIFYTPKHISWLPKTKQRVFGPKRFWTILGLSLEMLLNKPDVLFVPVHTLPFFCPKKTYRIIHDIASVKNPSLYSLFECLLMRFDVWRSVRICKKIFVSTSEVKKDLLAYTKATEDQVVVTGFGYTQKNKKVKKYKNKKKQLFYIGRIEQKKNIQNLVEAFRIFSRKYPEYTLVLAGKKGIGFEKIIGFVTRYQLPVTFLGYISEQKKHHLFQESTCLIHVPFEEGFSFPLLEAFDFSLPVLTSDIPVLREVGGEACKYINPNSVEDIAHGIETIVYNSVLRDSLVSKGKERLLRFSWQKTVTNILEAMTL